MDEHDAHHHPSDRSGPADAASLPEREAIPPAEPETRTDTLYASAGDALRAVRDDFHYWTSRVTDSSLQLALAVVAANWALFNSAAELRTNLWAQLSLAVVVAGVAIGLVGAKYLGDLHSRQIAHAGADPEQWKREALEALRHGGPWPYTEQIVRVGWVLREIRTWSPLLAFAFFLGALFTA